MKEVTDQNLPTFELPKKAFVRSIEDIWNRFAALGVPDRESMGPIISAAVNCYAIETPLDPRSKTGSVQWAQLPDGSIFQITRKFDQNTGMSMYVIEKVERKA